jgi:hypothetical protein
MGHLSTPGCQYWAIGSLKEAPKPGGGHTPAELRRKSGGEQIKEVPNLTTMSRNSGGFSLQSPLCP